MSSFIMRLLRRLIIGLVPLALAGCLHESDRPAWMNRIPLLRQTPQPDSAALEYVIVERPANSDEINRRVWDRVDELIFPAETLFALQTTGLRVGIASESTPGPLRKLIDDPRSGRGHRFRTFPLDKPAPLLVSNPIPHADVTIPAGENGSTRFVHDDVSFGFEITVRDGSDGKAIVKLVPHAHFRDPSRILPVDGGERDFGTETFPAAGFEISLAASEYLVIGTDFYRDRTFGHAAMIGEHDDRVVQRLLVLRAGRTKSERDMPAPGPESQATAPPLASQATMVRGVSP
jgi:hypothetical protein